MGKKILVLLGSPREDGNSHVVADSFIKAASEAGNQVALFDVSKMNVAGCVGCEECFTDNKPCANDDDFNTFAEKLMEADSLVMIAPIYWYSFPSQMKAVIDRMYCFYAANVEMSVKEAFLFVCGYQREDSIYSGMLRTYEEICKHNHWLNKGHFLLKGVHRAGQARTKIELEDIKKIGKYF